MRVLVNFATRHPGPYLGICAVTGLVIRWYACGQDLSRWLNPLAPFFA